MRRARVPLMIFGAALLLLGCASSTGTADCATTVRYEGSIYRESGFTDTVADEIGMVDLADCDDMGADAQGSYFSDNPEQVAAWSLPGKDVARLIAIPTGDGRYNVMKALNDQ